MNHKTIKKVKLNPINLIKKIIIKKNNTNIKKILNFYNIKTNHKLKKIHKINYMISNIMKTKIYFY